MTTLLKNATLYADPAGNVHHMMLKHPGSPFPFENQDGVRYTVTGRLAGQEEATVFQPYTKPVREVLESDLVTAIILVPTGMDLPASDIEVTVFGDESIIDHEGLGVTRGTSVALHGQLMAVRQYISSIDTGSGIWNCSSPMIGDWTRDPVIRDL